METRLYFVDMFRSLGLSAALLMTAPALAQTRISFPPRSDSGFWAGHTNGAESFVLNLARGQSFLVLGTDVYTWSIRASSGLLVPCDNTSGATSCAPGTTALLPETGDYVVKTTHRMSGGALQGTVPSRYVRITFTAR